MDKSKFLKIFASVRTRVLLGCILLMSFSGLASTFFIGRLLYTQLDERIHEELQEESGEFAKQAATKNIQADRYSSKYLADMFRNFVDHEIDQHKYYFLIVNNHIYQTSERKLPNGFYLDKTTLDSLSNLSITETRKIELDINQVIYYNAMPIYWQNGQRGILVVVFDATEDRQSIMKVMTVIIEVTTCIFVISSIAAMIDTKYILQPLQLLTTTASSIGDTDLTKRIPVRGQNEIADLTVTFNEMLDRLQASFNSQKEFFNNAGHELRTPLTIIRVNLEMLSDDPQDRKETIALVTDELDRISRYVNDMILLAKSERPDFLILETVSLSDLTQEIYSKVTALGQRHWQLVNVGKGNIVCDRHRLTQVVMNLAQNAIQQTQFGDPISIGSLMKNGKALFWVQDCGSGIDPSLEAVIFDRAISGQNCTKEGERMGLGLAIVKAIVEAHRGEINLVSEPERGSKFTIAIPIDPACEMLRI